MINHQTKSRLPWVMLPTILALAWPTMLEQLMQTAVQYIDTAMVGTLGTNATAAVGATTTVNWLVGSTISAIGVGFLAFIAQALGAGKEDDIRQASAQAFKCIHSPFRRYGHFHNGCFEYLLFLVLL